MGSASEVEYHLMLSRDLHYLSQSAHDELAQEAQRVKRMLAALLKTLRRT
jgi:four helix bundle protein